MSSHAPVVVRKGGFLSSLVLGLFGTIAVVVICTAAVVIYGMNLVDRKFDQIVRLTPEMLQTLEDWQSFLPPVLSDALRDRRDPAYREQVEMSVDFLIDDNGLGKAPVLSIDNTGQETISLLGVRIVVENNAGTPLRDWVEYPVTPLALEHEWPGPLLPGSDRRFRLHGQSIASVARPVRLEIVELRTWIDSGSPPGRILTPERPAIPLGQPRTLDDSAAPPNAIDADEAMPADPDPDPAQAEAAETEPGAAEQPERLPHNDVTPPTSPEPTSPEQDQPDRAEGETVPERSTAAADAEPPPESGPSPE